MESEEKITYQDQYHFISSRKIDIFGQVFHPDALTNPMARLDPLSSKIQLRCDLYLAAGAAVLVCLAAVVFTRIQSALPISFIGVFVTMLLSAAFFARGHFLMGRAARLRNRDWDVVVTVNDGKKPECLTSFPSKEEAIEMVESLKDAIATSRK